MEAVERESSSGGASDTRAYLQDRSDDDDEEHLCTSGKGKSKARWIDEMGMAEVLEDRSEIWRTIGITCNDKIYCSIEETLFLMEIGPLLLFDDKDRILSLREIYAKVAGGKSGCTWELFEVYKHLKSLGYIVGRHGIPWSMKGVESNCQSVSLQGSPQSSEVVDIESKDERHAIGTFNDMQINYARPVFDVFLPNSKFRKSSPDDPSFMVCLTRGDGPFKADIEVVDRQYGGIPLLFCHVEYGLVSFFSFEKGKLYNHHIAQLKKKSSFLRFSAVDWESSLGGASDMESCLQNTDDDDEEHYFTSGTVPKLQFRKDKSKARWNDEIGMAEILENRGNMWRTTGIARGGKIYCSIEETLFLMEIGALLLLDGYDRSLSLRDIYAKVAEGKYGCSWEFFEVYRHLKSLGYIVGRHGIPWSMKGVERSVIGMFNDMQINEARPVFNVYLPSSKFKKSSPGDPNFVLCLTRGNGPFEAEIEVLQRKFGGIPLLVCHENYGLVNFFSFGKRELSILP